MARLLLVVDVTKITHDSDQQLKNFQIFGILLMDPSAITFFLYWGLQRMVLYIESCACREECHCKYSAVICLHWRLHFNCLNSFMSEFSDMGIIKTRRKLSSFISVNLEDWSYCITRFSIKYNTNDKKLADPNICSGAPQKHIRVIC